MSELPTLAQCSALIRSRRSLKPVDMEPARAVADEVLAELLENATWAPTHGLTQPWRFRIFAGGARAGLAAKLQLLYQSATPAAEFREDKFAKMGQNPLLAPVIIACSMQRDPSHKIVALEEIEAVACAIQNLMLSATAAGLGSFWSSPPVIGHPEFAQWLGLGAEDQCCGLIYLGYAKEGRQPAAVPRLAVEKVATWASE
ncbi:MAG: nitroreductase [Verrucomicrobiales bacterium]|nr:nitroreductase [Verrucomicrobiales bacterium]MCP5559809.1 nitroreductase [Verrucomicrobiaceae bacterium]